MENRRENFNDIYDLQIEMKSVLGTGLSEMAQGPTADRPPAGVKDAKGKKLWVEFFKKYEKSIFKHNDVGKQWATAVAIFKNFAKKRGIKIFSDFNIYAWNKFIGEQIPEFKLSDLADEPAE